MEKVRNITKNIINVLCVLFFIILVLVIYAKIKITFSNDIHANYFGYRLLEVASGSMEPTLYKNDVLLVKVNDQNINKDDIIAYQSNNDIITHRVVMINDDNLLVKGDANNTVDSPIKKEQVIGKIVKVFPKLGIWKKILTEPKILILIFATLLLFDAALSYNGKDKKEEKKEIKKEEKPKKEETDLIVTEIKTDKDEEQNEIEAKEIDEYLDKNEEEIKEQIKNESDNEDQEEEKDIDYTIRLDLNEIQKNINKSVK